MKDLKMNLHFLKHFFGPFWDDSVLRHYMYTIIEKNNTFFIPYRFYTVAQTL